MLLEIRCGACGVTGSSPCADCVAKLRFCQHTPMPAGLDRCEALLSFEGVARPLIAGIKYRNQRAALRWLASEMATMFANDFGTSDAGPLPINVLTWAPTQAKRRRRRGFDQAELLARRLSGQLRLPVRDLLRRGAGPQMTGLGADERRRSAAYEPLRSLDGATVLIVDDVMTTGATLTAAGRALREAGAGSVWALLAARTP